MKKRLLGFRGILFCLVASPRSLFFPDNINQAWPISSPLDHLHNALEKHLIFFALKLDPGIHLHSLFERITSICGNIPSGKIYLCAKNWQRGDICNQSPRFVQLYNFIQRVPPSFFNDSEFHDNSENREENSTGREAARGQETIKLGQLVETRVPPGRSERERERERT